MAGRAIQYFIVSYEGTSVVREKGPIHGGRAEAMKWLAHFRAAEPNRKHQMEGRMPPDKRSRSKAKPPHPLDPFFGP